MGSADEQPDPPGKAQELPPRLQLTSASATHDEQRENGDRRRLPSPFRARLGPDTPMPAVFAGAAARSSQARAAVARWAAMKSRYQR